MAPTNRSVYSLLVLFTCIAFSNSENVTEGSEFENVITEVMSSTEPTADLIVGEKNTTTNDAIVAIIRDAFRLLGMEVSSGAETEPGTAVIARGKMSKLFHPLMLVPGLIVWGFAPITIAKLKWFIMQALMFNNMLFMSVLYMTLTNIVFARRPGPIVKYANYGYGPNRFNHYHRH